MGLMISCKEATFLVSKQEEGKLTISKRIKLKLHLAGCKICKLFAEQSSFIARFSAKADAYMSGHTVLPEEDKQKIRSSLNG